MASRTFYDRCRYDLSLERRNPRNIPRGAGLPDEFIAYIGSLVGHPIEFYSCFISYAGKDQEFATRLYDGLQGQGVRCWFAPHDVKAGEKLHEQIDAAIRLHDKLLPDLVGAQHEQRMGEDGNFQRSRA